MLKSLKFSKIKYDTLIFVFAILLFLPATLKPIGFVASSFLLIMLAAILYLWEKMEILIGALLVSPIVKMLEINPLPKWLDMTILLYIVVFGGFLFLFLIGKKKFEKFKIPDLFFIIFTIIVIFSYFFTPHEVKNYGLFKLTRFLILYVPMFFIPKLINSETGYAEITKGIIIFGSISGVLILLFFSTGYDMIHGGINYLNVAKIAGFVAIFTLCEFLRRKTIPIKIILGLLFLFQLFILFRAGSRGGILSFLISFLFLISIYYRKHLFKGVFVLVVVLSFILIVLFNSPKTFERVNLLFLTHKGGSVSDRLIMLKISLNLIKERWFTGIGIGGFAKYHYLQYPHNLPIEIFVEMGIAGFLSIMLIYFYSFKNIIQNGVKSIQNNSIYSPYYLSAIFAISYHMTSFGLEWTRILFFFIGVVLTINQKEKIKI